MLIFNYQQELLDRMESGKVIAKPAKDDCSSLEISQFVRQFFSKCMKEVEQMKKRGKKKPKC